MSQRNYPDLLEAYLDYTKGHEGTEKIHKWSFLSICAALLERKVWLDRGYYTLFPNLYVFIIGRSGLVKKTTSTGIAIDLYRGVPGTKIMSERVTASSLINQLMLSGKFFHHGETKLNQSAVFCYASELAVLLQEVFGSIVELLTTFYDCVPHDCKKPWAYSTIGRGETKIYGPCLNILGASTATWLRKLIPATEQEGGFASRVIFVVEKNPPTTLVPWPVINESAKAAKSLIIEDLVKIHELTGPFTVSDAAYQYFSTWYTQHMTEVVPFNYDAKMAGYMGRKADHILKIAMLRSILLGDSRVIEVSHVEWAKRELEDLEIDMREAFGDTRGILTTDVAFEMLNYVKVRKVVERTELYKVFTRRAPPQEIANAIALSRGMGQLFEKTDEREGLKLTFYSSAPFLE